MEPVTSTSLAGVCIVCGPPGSGKTTFVQQHMRPGDIVLDMDTIVSALTGSKSAHPDYSGIMDTALSVREAVYKSIESGKAGKRAFVITSSSDRKQVDGQLLDLNATTEELLLKHDRSFIFNVDRLDQDETQQQLEAGTALARELREVVVPEVDTNAYTVMTTGAGHKPAAAALTKSNIYAAILAASQALDDAEVPETERTLVVTPATYAILKQAVEFDHTEIGAEMRARGVVAMLDGAAVVKVPSARLPEKFGFMLAHPSATVAPVKLEDFGIHNDTPLSSGSIVTGRICYDAFVLDNKKIGIYYQATT